MELLDRHRSLRQELDARGGRLPADEVLRIGQELLAGLRVVHERGLVHCDVKPANVMLGPGPAKLIDFGIARSPREAIEAGTSIGSLHFMSPEHLHGRPLTPASDLFSLSVVLYEALSGRLPFRGDTPEEISTRQSAGVRPPSTIVENVPGRLDEAILQGLRNDPAQRFHTADAMSRALGSATEAAAPPRRDDTTAIHPVAAVAPPPPSPARAGGYVPPPAPEPPPPRAVHRPAPPPPARAAPRRTGGSIWSLLGTLAILAAAGAVVVFAILLIRDARQGGAGETTPPASVAATPLGATVAVPDTVGMPTADAIAAANAAGLRWTVYCNHDEEQPEGIIDQEPRAGTEVARGSAFSMYSARIADCP
jgi:serine/threonine-protein kinase